MKRKLFFIIFSLLLAGCAAPAPQKTEITLLANEFKFEPASITVPVGQPVTLTIKNKGAIEHDFVIQKIKMKDVVEQTSSMNMGHDMAGMNYDLHVATMGGESSVITFTPVEAGTYEFFCAIKGHKESGMTGTMVVTK
jgi:uncharacterized cupredoxin-like copper-binding protein